MRRIASRQRQSGPAKGRLLPEPLSTDLEGHYVDSVSGQIEAIEGLRAIGRVWSSNGYPAQAARARTLATSIDAALRPAVAHSVEAAARRLAVRPRPADDEAAAVRADHGDARRLVLEPRHAVRVRVRAGSRPHSPAARGIIRYLLAHGSRLLGVPRTYARTVYGDAPGAGLAQVYGLSTSRFLADNDQPDQLVLSLYGMLAAGMTADTYVSGEAISVLPVDGAYDRSMFMPPNSGANASYLETLHELLVHERRGPLGAPAGLDLAFSTPRAWLADGRQIEVKNAPTSLGEGELHAGAQRLVDRRAPGAAEERARPAAAARARGRAAGPRARRLGGRRRLELRDDRPRRPLGRGARARDRRLTWYLDA